MFQEIRRLAEPAVLEGVADNWPLVRAARSGRDPAGIFAHHVFRTGGDPAAHRPEDERGILGAPTAQSLMRMRQVLRERLKGG